MSLAGWEEFDMVGVGSVISDLATVRVKAGNQEIYAGNQEIFIGNLEIFVPAIFAIGADNAVWQLSLHPQQGQGRGKPPVTYWKWDSLGKPDQNTSLVATRIGSRIAVAQNADGRLEVFALGTGGKSAPNGSLYHKWQTAVNGSWSDWAKFDPVDPDLSIQDLQISRTHTGALDVFVRLEFRNNVARLAHIWQTAPNNGWGVWTDIGSPPDDVMYENPTVPTFAVALNGSGIQEVFATGDYWGRGKDNKQGLWNQKWIWRSAQTAPDNADWGPWEPIGRPVSSDLENNRLTIGAVSLNRNQLLELFVDDSMSIYVMSQRAVGDYDCYPLYSRTVYAQGGYAVGAGSVALEVFAWGQTKGNMNPDGTLWRLAEAAFLLPVPPHFHPKPPILYWDSENWEQVDANALPRHPAQLTNGGLHLIRNQGEHLDLVGYLDVIAVGSDGNVYSNWQT
jgi:hypothetical protein